MMYVLYGGRLRRTFLFSCSLLGDVACTWDQMSVSVKSDQGMQPVDGVSLLTDMVWVVG